MRTHAKIEVKQFVSEVIIPHPKNDFLTNRMKVQFDEQSHDLRRYTTKFNKKREKDGHSEYLGVKGPY